MNATNVTQKDDHVDARKRHILRADLYGQKVIAKSCEGSGRQDKEDHDGTMHGHQLQVVLRGEDTAGGPGFRQKADSWNGIIRPCQVNSHDPGQYQPDVNRHQRECVVLFADHLVIKAEDVLPDEPCRWSVMMNRLSGHIVHGMTLSLFPVIRERLRQPTALPPAASATCRNLPAT